MEIKSILNIRINVTMNNLFLTYFLLTLLALQQNILATMHILLQTLPVLSLGTSLCGGNPRRDTTRQGFIHTRGSSHRGKRVCYQTPQNSLYTVFSSIELLHSLYLCYNIKLNIITLYVHTNAIIKTRYIAKQMVIKTVSRHLLIEGYYN